jgi:hypothetical protein
MTTINVEELDDEHEQRHDYRRANGAPLVSDPADPTKTLRYSRPSSYAKCLDDEEALVNWRIWKAMDGVARSKALQTQVAATKEEDKTEKKALREKALDKGNANERADQGTGLHAMTARAEDDTDVGFDPPEAFVADLTAYRDALTAYGLVSEMTEVHMVNDDFRAAGTADRIFRATKRLLTPHDTWIEPGDLILGDLKTGKNLDFGPPNYCVQTALYATGRLYDIITERRLPTPPIRQDWTLLVHLPVGKARCTMHWCSVETGLIGARLAREVKAWRNLWKRGSYDIPAVSVPADPLDVLSVELGAEPEGVEVTVEQMAEYCQRRITTIGEHPKAKDTLILRWPADLPTPKKGLTDFAQIITLLNLLDTIEAQYSIPFLHTDPRMAAHKGKHRSEVDRSNEFLLSID